ncbi:hypothetical protein AAE478_001800 [Parahypoxylon ruwenzoriense]
MPSSPSSQPKKPPKGILKKPSTTAPVPAPTTTITSAPIPRPKSEKPDPRDVAIRRANIIHQQYELEDQVQDSIIELSRFPLASSSPDNNGGNNDDSNDNGSNNNNTPTTYDAANPSPADASAFRSLVRLFQPGDYEDLIEERNARGLCGYVLCGRARIKFGSNGGFKLVNYGRADFNIVPRKELERWCSQQCARRAMYVKVQLSETAAWERAGIPSIQIDLLDEPDSGTKTKEEADEDDATERVRRELQSIELDKERKATRNARDLAMERGDAGDKQSTRSVEVTVTEKSVTKAVEEPSLSEGNDAHLMLDGYKPKFDTKSETISKGSNVAKVVDEKPSAQ